MSEFLTYGTVANQPTPFCRLVCNSPIDGSDEKANACCLGGDLTGTAIINATVDCFNRGMVTLTLRTDDDFIYLIQLRLQLHSMCLIVEHVLLLKITIAGAGTIPVSFSLTYDVATLHLLVVRRV